MSTTRLLLLIAALTNPFCWLPLIMTAQSTLAELKTGAVRGIVFIPDSGGGRSRIANAMVRLEGRSVSIQTVTDDQGNYSFAAVVPGTYRIVVTAPGLTGSDVVTVVSGTSLDAPIQLRVEAIKQSLTVTSKEPAISKGSSDEMAINRSAVLNAPNKYERFDALLPLIPGVVRGPDGLINIKGARSSQGGALLNSANVTDPATGNELTDRCHRVRQGSREPL
jgi:hypothetical protein